jgi:hypothetical protein
MAILTDQVTGNPLAALISPQWEIRSARFRSAATGILAIAATLSFYWLRNKYIGFLYAKPDSIFVISLASLVGALGFAFVQYHQFPRAFSVVTRATATGVLVYLVTEPSDFTLANSNHSDLAGYADWGYWAALGAAMASLIRPSFLFPAAFYVTSTRFVVQQISGFPLSTLDIQYMMEMAQFLACSACGLALLMWIKARSDKFITAIFSIIDPQLLAVCFTFVAFGFHLGNYFWSGYQKLIVGPHLWSWVLENQTQNIMVIALKKGVLPSGAVPSVTQWVFDKFGSMVPLSNLFVVLTQLFAIVAAMRVRGLIMASLAYDILHVGIYVVGGLFFWPWIWNNGSIMVSLRSLRDEQIRWVPKLCCVLTILLGASANLGDAARLAWFDVLDIKIGSIQAEMPDGNWADVPASYFLSNSYSVSHGEIDYVATQGHYPPTIWGSVYDYKRAKTSGQCPQPSPVTEPEIVERRTERLERLSKFLVAHHRKMVHRAAEYGSYNYYLRFHHQPSNPWLYSDFNHLELDRIFSYRLVTQSVCLTLLAGKLEERELKRDEVKFDVR